jgi:hypothetical protein
MNNPNQTNPAEMGEELLPCPFCGCAVSLEKQTRRDEYFGSRDWWHIVGKHEGIGGVCPGQVRGRGSSETATTAWNTRAALQQSHTEGDRLLAEAGNALSDIGRAVDGDLMDRIDAHLSSKDQA